MKNDAWRTSLLKLKKYRYPALILVLGLLLMVLPFGDSGGDAGIQEEETDASEEFDLETFTREAEALLSELQGAGEVRLLLTLESDGRRDYLTDTSASQGADSSQSQAQTVVVTRDGDQEPVTVSRIYPEFRGAVVLCQGADSPTLILAIKEALSSLTGLGMDRITVLKSD